MVLRQTQTEKRLVLIDGHAVLYRAFHALPQSLTTKDGKPVNAVYGFSRMLFKIFSDLNPTHLAVAFDLPKPTFRHKLFKDYQATRPKMAQELADQIKPVRQVIKAFDIPIFEKAGFEADDVLGTLARKATVDEVVIITGDRDIFQLIDQKTQVYALKRGFSGGDLVDLKKAEAILGVRPDQLVAYKALVGDPSDNYPGVNGIGPKTARKLIKENESWPKILKNLEEKERKAAVLSQRLAEIKTDLELDFNLQSCRLNFNPEKVKEVFEKLKFRSLIKELEKKKREQMRLL